MPLIALGWCKPGKPPPAPVQVDGTGPIRAVCADQSVCPSARDRLRLLQSVFDAGIDCIALSPGMAWPLDLARSLAVDRADDLMDQIDQISGAGQLSVAITWDDADPIQPFAPSGKSWLRARHARQRELKSREDGARGTLLRLIEDLAVPRTDVARIGSGVAVTLLIQRDAIDIARSRLETTARDVTAPPGMNVVVTGLWPPLDFVSLPEQSVGVSA